MPLEGVARIERDEEKRELVRRAEGTTVSLIFDLVRQHDPEVLGAVDEWVQEELKEVAEVVSAVPGVIENLPYFRASLSLFQQPMPFEGNAEARTIAEWALARFPDQFRQDQRQFVESVRAQPFRWLVLQEVVDESYVQLLDIETSETFISRDLGLSGCAEKGSILLAAVFQMWGNYYLYNAFPQAIPGDHGHLLVEFSQHALGPLRGKPPPGFSPETVQWMQHDLVHRQAFFLAVSALFERQANPQLCNMDGEPLEPRTITYTLHADPAVIFAELIKRSRVFKATESSSRELIWYGARPKRDASGEPYVRGSVEVKPRELVIHVNSVARANRLCSYLEKALQDDISFLSETLVEPRGSPGEEEERPLPPEVVAEMQQRMDQHYNAWVDQPIPALGGKTPREAARDPKARPLLEALLLEFERRTEDRGTGFIGPDIQAIRSRLFNEETS